MRRPVVSGMLVPEMLAHRNCRQVRSVPGVFAWIVAKQGEMAFRMLIFLDFLKCCFKQPCLRDFEIFVPLKIVYNIIHKLQQIRLF